MKWNHKKRKYASMILHVGRGEFDRALSDLEHARELDLDDLQVEQAITRIKAAKSQVGNHETKSLKTSSQCTITS